MEIVVPEEYVMPEDGYDYCEWCNYLEPVFETYCLDDGSCVVPLCESCWNKLSADTVVSNPNNKKGEE